MQLCRTRGCGALNGSVYSGHKRTNLLVFLTMTTFSTLLLSSNGSLEGLSHDLTLFWDSVWEKQLQGTHLVRKNSTDLTLILR